MEMFTLVGHGEHRNLPVTIKFTAEQKLTWVALCDAQWRKEQSNKNSFLPQWAPRFSTLFAKESTQCCKSCIVTRLCFSGQVIQIKLYAFMWRRAFSHRMERKSICVCTDQFLMIPLYMSCDSWTPKDGVTGNFWSAPLLTYWKRTSDWRSD